MNYFAHGLRFLDRPYFVAGTAVPDWLSVVDRRVRMRSRRVEPVAAGDERIAAEVAAGVLQHLHDDQWFHSTRGFAEVTGQMTRLFREAIGPDDGFRPSFLGHIVTELLMDGVLIEQHPGRLDAYYAALAEVDPTLVQTAVNSMARDGTPLLAPFIGLFQREQILRDYAGEERLLFRLNQVMRRIKLKPLADDIRNVLREGRVIVRERLDDLLPPEHFA